MSVPTLNGTKYRWAAVLRERQKMEMDFWTAHRYMYRLSTLRYQPGTCK